MHTTSPDHKAPFMSLRGDGDMRALESFCSRNPYGRVDESEDKTGKPMFRLNAVPLHGKFGERVATIVCKDEQTRDTARKIIMKYVAILGGTGVE